MNLERDRLKGSFECIMREKLLRVNVFAKKKQIKNDKYLVDCVFICYRICIELEFK